MLSARENRCHRFQANIFNKSQCQTYFKTGFAQTQRSRSVSGEDIIFFFFTF
uniref:Uncharacterized protein n=1 Tax=Cyprinus carpio TaxID=7962 RepID=A0A8C2DLP0_CYPCA